MKNKNILISTFVVVWLFVFYYESTRAFFLEPWLHRPLPKVKFLFPPAGWIMFYNLDDSFGYVEVYGVKGERFQLIDPHQILQTRAIGYDNIHRNALITIASRDMQRPFCAFLKRKFSYFESFKVVYVNYPSLSRRPLEQEKQVIYECQ